jgi:hypothetical protein
MNSSPNIIRVITSISKCIWCKYKWERRKIHRGVWLEPPKKRDRLENLYNITRDPERKGLPGAK